MIRSLAALVTIAALAVAPTPASAGPTETEPSADAGDTGALSLRITWRDPNERRQSTAQLVMQESLTAPLGSTKGSFRDALDG
jgi:hypothetical protein